MDDDHLEPGPRERLARLLAASVLEAVDAFPAGATQEDLVRYLRGDTPADPDEATAPEAAEGRLWFSKKKPLERLVEVLVTEGLLEHEDRSSGPPRLAVTAEGERFLADPDAADVALAGFGQSKGTEAAAPLSGEESALFERLRTLRNRRAHERDMPPYIICNNDVLKALARRRPASPAELSAVSGIGPSFMENHADAFLEAIADLGGDSTKDAAGDAAEEAPGDAAEDGVEGAGEDAPGDDAQDAAGDATEEAAGAAGEDPTTGSRTGSSRDSTAGATEGSAEDSTGGEASAQASIEEVTSGPDDETAVEGPDDEAGDRGPGASPSPASREAADPAAPAPEATDPEATDLEATYQGGSRTRAGTRTARSRDPPSKDEAREVLSDVFGHEAFLPGQWEVIERVLAGESAVAIFPTGGGKSLCYQLPAVMGDATTLVVSPLKALMKDQVDALQARGVAAAREDSSTSYRESQETLAGFADGSLDVLYVAPERFNNDRFVEALSEATIDVLAIDEAHCISEWGHSFRPDYLKLARYADQWEIPQVLGLTATATPRVAEDMCASFGIPEENVHRLPSHRENLDLHVRHVPRDQRYDALVEALEEEPVGPTIVYAKRRKTTERLAEALAEDGFPAQAFHAGLDDEEKDEIQDWFMDTTEGVIVATIAFGMGVDKPDIRRIVHHNMPSSLEAYAQQIGRAGRDGERSRCTFLYCPDDVNLCTNYEWGTTPTTDEFQAVLERLFAPASDAPDATGAAGPGPGAGPGGGLPTLDFLAYEKEVGVPRNKVRTLVALLENEGFLQQHTPVNAKFRYRLLEPEPQVANALPGEDRRLLRQVQAQADHKTKWSHLHVPTFVEEAGVPRTRLGDLMDDLAAQGLAESQARDYVHPYEVLDQPDDLEAMARRYRETFQGLEDRAVERVRDVPRRLSEARCIWEAVAEHFGEEMDGPCGHCSTCREGEAPELPLPEAKAVPEEAEEHLAEALEEAPGLEEEPLVLAEFLCGRYSVGVRTHGLHRLDGYRCLEFHGLEDVLGWVRGEVGVG